MQVSAFLEVERNTTFVPKESVEDTVRAGAVVRDAQNQRDVELAGDIIEAVTPHLVQAVSNLARGMGVPIEISHDKQHLIG